MFWDDADEVKRKHARILLPPPVPDLGWRVPDSFPNLAAASWIGVDCETKEYDELDEHGPGWGRGRGHIVGVSLAAVDRAGNRGSWYFPVRHEFDPHLNMDTRNVFGYLRDTLRNTVPKVGANITYDIGHLGEEQVYLGGDIHDIQFAEACIDNNAEVGLDVQSHKYLGKGKTTDHMYNWIRAAYPGTPETKLRANIYRTSPKLVGFYAEDDAMHPIDILQKQLPVLERENLMYVYRLECDIIPVMIAMRRAGVTVDVNRAENLIEEIRGDVANMYKRISDEFGINLKSTSSGEIARLFDHVGIEYPRTAAGNPSIRKEYLAGLLHPASDVVNSIREHEKISGTFLKGYVIGKNVNGKLHPQFHQLRGESNGTKVGRFSSSTPNLQNIPSRTKLGKRVRECFVPDTGHSHWRKLDYSQIHYRILADNAVDDGDGTAEALRQRYINDPTTDYHMDVYRNVAPLIGWSLTDPDEIAMKRRPVKNVNFGLLYGQSEDSLAYKSGLSGDAAKQFFAAYFLGAPYVKPTMKAIEAEMQRVGYVTTALGRRIRFTEFEPARRGPGEKVTPLPYALAMAKWGHPLKYSYGYRAVNYKFQGTEPDIMKEGMRNLWRSGVWDYTGIPRLTVHDECDYSVPEDSPRMNEAFTFIKHTMEAAVKLRVPVYADMTRGSSWGKSD